MTTSPRQRLANQQNAAKSTGPRTAKGKEKVAVNAIRHGILSTRLTLEHETRDEFESLFDELVACLHPVGTMELTLVERIAINLWRQRRLVCAESAGIELQLQPGIIAKVVSEELYGPFSSKQISETELEGPDPTHVDWCRRVLQESENLPEDDLEHCEVLENVAPLMYAQLIEDAETDEETVGGYLELLDGGLFEYVQDLIIYCRDEFEKTKQAPAIKQLETWVRAERSIPRGNLQEKLMRYQIGLDNELYKALRALRDAQKWRREAMEVQVNASKGADEQQLAV